MVVRTRSRSASACSSTVSVERRLTCDWVAVAGLFDLVAPLLLPFKVTAPLDGRELWFLAVVVAMKFDLIKLLHG